MLMLMGTRNGCYNSCYTVQYMLHILYTYTCTLLYVR